jgi:hypothetical protein
MALRSNYALLLQALGICSRRKGAKKGGGWRGLERLRKRPRNQSWAALDATLMLERPAPQEKKVKDTLEKVSSSALSSNNGDDTVCRLGPCVDGASNGGGRESC